MPINVTIDADELRMFLAMREEHGAVQKERDELRSALRLMTAERDLAEERLRAYGMAKAAIDQLVRNLALELGPFNISVNSINPGAVRTDFSRVLWEDPEREKKVAAGIPMGRIGEPDDVAGLALLLASPAGHISMGKISALTVVALPN